MVPKTPATASPTRRFHRKAVLEKLNGLAGEASSPADAPAAPEAAAGAVEMVNGRSGKTKRAVADAAGKGSSGVKRKKGASAPAGESGDGEVSVKEVEEEVSEGLDEEVAGEPKALTKKAAEKSRGKANRAKGKEEDGNCGFVGEPFSKEEAKQRWPHRYEGSKQRDGPSTNREEEEVKARCHFGKAQLDDCTYELYDDVYVKAGEGETHYIGRIIELFESTDKKCYFTSQWFFRAEDTVMKEQCKSHDERRVFLSEEKNDNILDCIVSKVKIVRVAPNIDLAAKESTIPPCDLYYDMAYDPSYATFANLPAGNGTSGTETSASTVCSEENAASDLKHDSQSCSDFDADSKAIASLLDLYAGCGAMSTGLCLGAQLCGMNLETRWAVDFNEHACESLKLNHPNVEVRNEKAEDFLALLREWEILCKRFSLIGSNNSSSEERESHMEDEDYSGGEDISIPRDEFEVGKIVGICYGDPGDIGKIGLKFKVRWKGYGPSEDTWEPIDGLSKCDEHIKDFVRRGYKSRILPLPGLVDVICGGPPCQGISGFNRFRNFDAPLNDTKNLYDGCGLLWSTPIPNACFPMGARPSEGLPQFPLPTHNVILRGVSPNEFEHCLVAYDEDQPRYLEDALVLGDAISDLPPVTNDEERDEMPYGGPPKTDFQHSIRVENQMSSSSNKGPCTSQKGKLYDHRPLKLNQDDYDRVCQIPKEKGANFRNLRGVRVRDDNTAEWDPDVERVYLPSGKPLVPDYAIKFVKGKSCKPFARLWWDETVPTVVTRAEPHNQAILHPVQDRVLTIRENARLQGFPDCYKLCGPIKERYIQVGNAVAVPVARALGYALGLAYQGICGDQYLFQLPCKFPRLDGVSSAMPSASDNGVVLDSLRTQC